MANKSTKNDSHTGMKLAFLGGLVAAAAGAYFVTNAKSSKKHLKKIKGWALKAKGDVLSKLETLKNVDEELYHKAVDTVVSKYKNVKNIDTSELNEVGKELKSHWNSIKKELAAATKSTARSASHVAKQAKRALAK